MSAFTEFKFIYHQKTDFTNGFREDL